MNRVQIQGRACMSCKPTPSFIDKVIKDTFLQVLFISFLSVIVICAPGKAWDESDKQAFEEKIDIIGNMIKENAKSLSSGPGKLDPASLRFQCLLQSIGIDVVHRYLEFNPGDPRWKQNYVELRNGLTVCLYVMYNPQKVGR